MRRDRILRPSAAMVFFLLLASPFLACGQKIMAHRGASAVMVENSLSSFVLAASQKSDFISMDVVMTYDDHLVVFYDIDIASKTNVREVFPERARQDGKFYISDFTLAEIQQLHLLPQQDGQPIALRIPTLTDTLSLLRLVEKALGNPLGVAIEIKKPWFFQSEGKDISNAVLDLLQHFQYTNTNSEVFLLCHDPEELQRIHKTLLPSRGIDFKLVQLLDRQQGEETQRMIRDRWTAYNSDWIYTRLGTKLLGLYADAIGIDGVRLLEDEEDATWADFLKSILSEDVKIHATINSDNSSPKDDDKFHELLSRLFDHTNIDVFVSNSPEAVLAFFKQRDAENMKSEANSILPLFTPTPLKE